MKKSKKVKEIQYGVYCGHRFYPKDGSGPVPDTRTKQEIEKFLENQRRINNDT